MDDRLKKIASNMVDNAVKLKKGDTLFLEARGEKQLPLAKLIYEHCQEKGIEVIKFFQPLDEYNEFWSKTTPERNKLFIKEMIDIYKKADASIAVRQYSGIKVLEGKQRRLLDMFNQEVNKVRLSKPWCLTSVPTPESAKSQNKDFEQMYETYLNSAALNYSKFAKGMKNLSKYIEKCDKVHIIGPGTDLTFSIKGMPSIPCLGEHNIPDGEIFTAPVRESVNGKISYNTTSLENGFEFKDIVLEFKDGKIIKATSNNNELIYLLLDTDEGARYVGEFAFGVNPFINTPYNNTLYDEKIAGSIHFTPGACYHDCPNGNNSARHWDLVLIQTPEYGGGEIWFDDILLRKDGEFVPEDLHCLNAEEIIKEYEK